MPLQYEVIEGVPLPIPLGGHPALDFCNTWAGWDGRDQGDYLASYAALAIWAGWSELLPADRVEDLRQVAEGARDQASAVLERARQFRAGLYEVLTSGASRLPWPQPLVDELRTAVGTCTWSGKASGASWRVDSGSGLAAPLTAVAWSALGLLTSPDAARVGACPGTGCGWLFLDASGRRRWCSMAVCGNRAKARRFADRARSSRH